MWRKDGCTEDPRNNIPTINHVNRNITVWEYLSLDVLKAFQQYQHIQIKNNFIFSIQLNMQNGCCISKCDSYSICANNVKMVGKS